jgi:putative ABC transport system ATP-binding protein
MAQTKPSPSQGEVGWEYAMSNRVVIEVDKLVKTYEMGDVLVNALRGVSFTVTAGEMIAIMGPSGSGKSTLMNLIGCLDVPTSGSYRLDGEEVGKLSSTALAKARSQKIGFVFQQFNLLARTTALENVELPLMYAGISSAKQRREGAIAALTAVGLADRMRHRPNELSGGQQQRVAIARALVNSPTILLADEPTGNLDSRSSEEIMAIFQRLNHEQGITVIFVTHEADIAKHTRRILRIRDGLLASDEPVLAQVAIGEAAKPEPEQARLDGQTELLPVAVGAA